MGLTLGKIFNRSYDLRIPFLDGYYNINIFFNTKSPFLLFGIDPDFSMSKKEKPSAKISMFKNIESSQFSSIFLNLHNYKSSSLDIINQFKEIKDEYLNDIVFTLNENLTLSKVVTQDSVFYDQILIYGFTISSYQNEFLYILTERQNIVSKLKKKIVRTSALQIATSSSLNIINEYYQESIKSKSIYEKSKIQPDEVIKLT